MAKERTFNIVWVRGDHGAGEAQVSKPDKTVRYSGEVVSIRR
jgi:hypothetical protein